ncbi:MAG: cell death suppressor protein Lls1, partial [Cyanothece sp. SIO2G6]|nr:cell death suppressor protein Lls1 [Cyanothece sp. SIO2G6]
DRPYAQACYLPTQADRYVIGFRKWVQDFTADPFADVALSPALSKPALLDRYQSHTQHCRSCRTALKRIQQIRTASGILSVLIWSSMPLVVALSTSISWSLGLFLTVVPLLSGACWLGLGTLEQKFYKGRAIPPRNFS